MSELNACPVCKKKPILQTVEGYPMQYKFFCGTHVSVGNWFPNTLGAEMDWNRRTADLTQPDFYKPTNADRIRGMNDVELLQFIVEVFCSGMAAENRGDDFDHSFAWPLDWLRQPAEEAHDGQTI